MQCRRHEVLDCKCSDCRERENYYEELFDWYISDELGGSSNDCSDEEWNDLYYRAGEYSRQQELTDMYHDAKPWVGPRKERMDV